MGLKLSNKTKGDWCCKEPMNISGCMDARVSDKGVWKHAVEAPKEIERAVADGGLLCQTILNSQFPFTLNAEPSIWHKQSIGPLGRRGD